MGQGKCLITFSFFYSRQGITKQFIQIQERNSMQFAAWFHYWSVSKRNLFIPCLMQFIKTQERRFSPVHCNNQLTALLLISETSYLTHPNSADSLPGDVLQATTVFHRLPQFVSGCYKLWSWNFVKWLPVVEGRSLFFQIAECLSLEVESIQNGTLHGQGWVPYCH